MAVEQWQTSAVLDALRDAADVGERVSRADLQEVCGIGASDLEAVLDELLGRGLARQEAPDEYEAVAGTDASEQAGLDAERDGGGELPAVRDRMVERRVERARALVGVGNETVLLRSMVEALEDGALGALVRAGMEGVDGEFVLRVQP